MYTTRFTLLTAGQAFYTAINTSADNDILHREYRTLAMDTSAGTQGLHVVVEVLLFPDAELDSLLRVCRGATVVETDRGMEGGSWHIVTSVLCLRWTRVSALGSSSDVSLSVVTNEGANIPRE